MLDDSGRASLNSGVFVLDCFSSHTPFFFLKGDLPHRSKANKTARETDLKSTESVFFAFFAPSRLVFLSL